MDRLPRAAVVGHAVAGLGGAVPVLLGARQPGRNRGGEGAVQDPVHVHDVRRARRQAVERVGAVGPGHPLREVAGDRRDRVLPRVRDVAGDHVGARQRGFLRRVRALRDVDRPADGRISARPAGAGIDVRQRGHVVDDVHRGFRDAGRVEIGEGVHRLDVVGRGIAGVRGVAPRGARPRIVVENDLTVGLCVRQVDGVPEFVGHDAGVHLAAEGRVFRRLGNGAAVQDHRGFEKARAGVADVLEHREPENAGPGAEQRIRERPVLVVDDVDAAAVPGAQDETDVRGVDVGQPDRGEIAGDRPRERGRRDRVPLVDRELHDRVGLLAAELAQVAEVGVDGRVGARPGVGSLRRGVVERQRPPREGRRRGERRHRGEQGEVPHDRPVRHRVTPASATTWTRFAPPGLVGLGGGCVLDAPHQFSLTARRTKPRNVPALTAPCCVVTRNFSLSSRLFFDTSTPWNSPALFAPLKTFPPRSANRPCSRPTVVRNPIVEACERNRSTCSPFA